MGFAIRHQIYIVFACHSKPLADYLLSEIPFPHKIMKSGLNISLFNIFLLFIISN
jgi:hypothetical protein